MSKVNALYHVVFNTYERRPTITFSKRDSLYRFIWDLLTERNCKLLRINGVENHLHMLIDLHPTLSLSWLIGEIKRRSSRWMKESGLFPKFDGWGREYFAFSCSQSHRDAVIDYIKAQPEHHGATSYEEELEHVFKANDMQWDNMYLN